jgi:cytochrome c oxidase subunit II
MVDTRRQYDDVATVYGAIAIAVFVLIAVLVVVFVVRYRQRDESRSVSRLHDAPRLESLYVAVLACVAAFLVAFTFIHENKSDASLKRHAGLLVRVVAAKWHWSFFYPALGIRALGTDATPPTLYVPARTNVDFQLTSADVIHAFWIPKTKFKRAAYPAVNQYFTLSFNRTGSFRNAGECAEYCGLLHAEMRFNLRVLSASDFRRWAARGGR